MHGLVRKKKLFLTHIVERERERERDRERESKLEKPSNDIIFVVSKKGRGCESILTYSRSCCSFLLIYSRERERLS